MNDVDNNPNNNSDNSNNNNNNDNDNVLKHNQINDDYNDDEKISQ